jgi:hypothetical protein
MDVEKQGAASRYMAQSVVKTNSFAYSAFTGQAGCFDKCQQRAKDKGKGGYPPPQKNRDSYIGFQSYFIY